jgi:hypothetical protein
MTDVEPRGRSLPAAVARTGARAAERFAHATRIDDAVEVVAEEAIVRATQSEAVERALARILAGPLVEEAVQKAVSSPNVERALGEALDSEMVDRLWQQLLVSEEVEQLFVRIGDAPELRAAIAAQGSGLVRDLGVGGERLVHRLDDVLETAIRRVFRRSARSEPSRHAGLASRGLAFVIDLAIINIGLVLSGLVAFLVSALTDSGSASTGVLVAGAGFWLGAGALYFAWHWALAGQTPGMHFVGLRLDSNVGRRIGFQARDPPALRPRRGGDPVRHRPTCGRDELRAPRLAGPDRADGRRLR